MREHGAVDFSKFESSEALDKMERSNDYFHFEVYLKHMILRLFKEHGAIVLEVSAAPARTHRCCCRLALRPIHTFWEFMLADCFPQGNRAFA